MKYLWQFLSTSGVVGILAFDTTLTTWFRVFLFAMITLAIGASMALNYINDRVIDDLRAGLASLCESEGFQ